MTPQEITEVRPRLLDFIDQEIGEALQYHLRGMGVTLRMGEKVVSIKKVPPLRGKSVATLGPDVTSFSETGLTQGKVYGYKIRAVNAGGPSEFSNIVLVTAPPPAVSGPPAAPTNLVATSLSATR